MTGLSFIMWTCLAFAGASLVLAAAMVTRRLAADLFERRHTVAVSELSGVLAARLNGDGEIEEIVRKISDCRRRDVVTLLFRYARMVSGVARDRLIDIVRHPTVHAIVLGELRQGSRLLACQSAALLAETGGDEATRALQAQLSGPYAEVRLTAAVALLKLDAVPSIAALLAGLRQDLQLKAESLRVLFHQLPSKFTLELIELLHSDTDDQIRGLAVEALGKSGDYRALQTLMLYTEAETPALRARSLQALEDLEHPGAAPAVRAALADPVWHVRLRAVACARAIGLTDLAEDVEKLLVDERWWVRFRAAEALYSFGEDGRTRLRNAVSGSGEARDIATQVLAEKES